MTFPGATVTSYIVRGKTVFFSTTFYDQNNNVVQPPSASINIEYQTGGNQTAEIDIPLVPPTPPATNWTCQWDSRPAQAGPTFWSVMSGTPIPIAVEDGYFVLTANPANIA